METGKLAIDVEERDELIASFEKEVFDLILESRGVGEGVKQFIRDNRCEVFHTFDHRDANIAELDFRLLSEDKEDLLGRVVITIRFIAVVNSERFDWKWEVKVGEDTAIDVANDLVKRISSIVSKPTEDNPLLQPPYDVNTTIEMMEAGGEFTPNEPIPVNVPDVTSTGEITPPLEIPSIQEEATDTVDPFMPEEKEETGFYNVRYLNITVDNTSLHRDHPTLLDAYFAMIKQSYHREISHLVDIHGIPEKLYAHDWVSNCDIDIATLTRLDKTIMMRLGVKYQIVDEDGLPKLIAEFKGNLGIVAGDGHVEINDTVISGNLVNLVAKVKAELDSLLK